ncbi:hypothetical protein D3C77_464540 [compost metagenome]
MADSRMSTTPGRTNRANPSLMRRVMPASTHPAMPSHINPVMASDTNLMMASRMCRVMASRMRRAMPSSRLLAFLDASMLRNCGLATKSSLRSSGSASMAKASDTTVARRLLSRELCQMKSFTPR